jgi:hypothetical protein
MMEEKHNHATARRPEGARPLDAPVIPIDIPKYINQIKHEEAYHKNGKNAITVFKSDSVTITLIALKAGENFHPGQPDETVVMSVHLLSGDLLFETLGASTNLKESQIITVHQALSFKAVAVLDCVCVLTLFK